MKKVLILIFLVITLVSCGKACETKECLDYKIQKEVLDAEERQKERDFQLNLQRVKAEIEASKPIEVKVAEKQVEVAKINSSGMTTGEGIVGAVGVAGGIYVLDKLLDGF